MFHDDIDIKIWVETAENSLGNSYQSQAFFLLSSFLYLKHIEMAGLV